MRSSLQAHGSRGFVYLLILVAVLGFLGALFGPGEGEAAPGAAGGARVGLIDVVMAALLGCLIAIAAHEAGHVILGVLVGFRPVLVSAWPFEVMRTRAGVRWRWASHLVLGMTSSVPAGDQNLRRRAIVYCAGGPLASLLAAGGGLWLALGRPTVARSLAHPFFEAMGLLSAAALVLDAIGRRGRGPLKSDGALIRMLARRPREAECWCAILALQGAAMRGDRPRDWDAALVARAASLADGSSFDAMGSLDAYFWALDRGDVAAAGDFLARALAASEPFPRPMRQEYLLEGAFFQARYAGHPAAARAHYDQAGATVGWLVEPHTELRAEAAVLVAEGLYAEAAERAERGLAAAARAWVDGTAQAERDWLAEILKAARSQPAAHSPGG